MRDNWTVAELARNIESCAARLSRLLEADAPAAILQEEMRMIQERAAELPYKPGASWSEGT